MAALWRPGLWTSLRILMGLCGKGMVVFRREATPMRKHAKKFEEVFKALPNLRLSSVFLTNNDFTKVMPKSLLL